MKINIIILTIGCLLLNCAEKEYKLSPEQLYQRAYSASTDNNEIITATEEIVDITAKVLIDEGISSGRWSETERACNPSVDHSYLIDKSHYDTLLYIGTMTMDYGTGESCTDVKYQRKGQIIDDFEYIVNYKKEIYWSKETITFKGFKKDSVQIDGEFLITSNSRRPVTVETKNAKITYRDGKFVAWAGTLELATERKNEESKSNTITGTITGITKRYETFSAIITSPVTYNYDCNGLKTPVPVKGSVMMIVNQEKSAINYGDGNCDNIFTLSVGERQTQLDL
jgi:hypothetical protein